MRLRVGTSGFAYRAWKGSFYPEKLRAADLLRYYGARFSTVEINATFYRLPEPSVLGRWAGEVPADFSFVLKAPRRITHTRRVETLRDDVATFDARASELGRKLGPLLFQFPPNLKKDVERLRALLALVPRRRRVACEFRHPSWFDADVERALRDRRAALCWTDTDDREDGPLVATADWGYLRLRRARYGPAALRTWAERIAAQPWKEAYVFFKHEDEGRGPRFAARLGTIAGAAAARAGGAEGAAVSRPRGRSPRRAGRAAGS